MAFAVATAACSTSEQPTDGAGTDAIPVTTEEVPVDEVGQAGEPTDSVQFLGAMVVAQTEPVVTAVDDDSVSLVLDPDASFAATSGAFPSASEVTTQVFDINLSAVFEDDIEVGDEAPWSRAYVVSTADPVDLTTPVTIEIARPVADLLVVQLIDGELVDVVFDGDAESTVIEIPHFSDVVTIVMNTWGPEAAELARQQVAKFTQIERRITAPADFLRTCLVAMISILNGQQFLDNVGPLAGTLGTNLAYSFCVNALVQGTAPNGVYVSTECVGGRISDGLDFVEAVDRCAADDNGEGAPEAETDPPSEEADDTGPDGQTRAIEPLPDGTWEGSTNNAWLLASGYEVTDDELRVVLEDGRLVEFVYRRDFTAEIPSRTGDPATDVLCTVNARIEFDTTRGSVVNSPGRIEISSEMVSTFTVPACDRDAPYTVLPDGPESYTQSFAIVARDGLVNIEYLEPTGGANQPIEPLIVVQ